MSVCGKLEGCKELFERAGVEVAYLFGSYATGRQHEDSDVDVGVVFGDPGNVDFSTISGLEKELSQELDKEVDVRVMDGGDPRFVYNILRTGEPVFIGDEGLRRGFEHRVMRKYLDMKPFYDEYDRYVEERVTA